MPTTNEFTVFGMTCGHCEMSVREEVQDIPGVTNIDVSHLTGTLVVTSKLDLESSAVTTAAAKAGYEAMPA